jgi:predicted TIM-barrel fold metal-dependent hydrolase
MEHAVQVKGAIDCDMRVSVPSMSALLPYLDEHWRDTVVARGISSLDSVAYPPNAPISARPDWRNGGVPARNLDDVRAHLLDHFGLRLGIATCLYGVHLLFDEYLAAAFARAVNGWLAAEWLDRESRLRASLVVPLQDPAQAAAEIEHWARDRRFVQVLFPAMDDMPLGKRHYWPVYEAAVRHGFAIGIHAGSAYRHPPTSVGWPTWHAEDYAAQSQAFQGQVTSLVTEGVFAKFPDLKVVLMESGVSWLPAYLWRFSKFWRGIRTEVPWVDRDPAEIVREHVFLTLQPFDAPAEAAEKLIDHIGGTDRLLFSSDYPHWQFDGDEVWPDGLPAVDGVLAANALSAYPRLKEDAA